MTESKSANGMPSAEELRAAARALEEAAAALADLAETPLPLEGTLQAFPRPAPQDRRLEEGLDILATESARAIATLRALATARERRLDLPPILLAPVQPYLDALGAAGTAPARRESGRGRRAGAAGGRTGRGEGSR